MASAYGLITDKAYAKIDFAGLVRLSAAPDDASEPIAVGLNDDRFNDPIYCESHVVEFVSTSDHDLVVDTTFVTIVARSLVRDVVTSSDGKVYN